MKTIAAGVLALGLLFGLLPSKAEAQSTCIPFNQGDIPTPGQWQNCFQSKQDLLGYVPLNPAGVNMTGRMVTAPSTTARAGFNIAPGTAPTTPVNGDLWITTTGLFARINGSTVGPFSASGSTIPTVAQGDLLYGSAASVVSVLSKNTTATRYLSNTGTSNNPAWAQVNLANGVTGLLPLANLATGTQDTVLGYFGSTAVSALSINNCAGALTYSTSTHTFGCNSTGSVVATGTPTINQLAQWTNSTTVQGVNLASLLSAGGGISLSGTTTVTVALANNGSVVNTSVAAPSGTTSTAGVMMGLGSSCAITPGYSSRIRFTIQGSFYNNTTGQGVAISGRYGTGTAPANGVSATGSLFLQNSISGTSSTASGPMPFSASGTATGLTPGVAVWFDLVLSATANSAFVRDISCSAQEF